MKAASGNPYKEMSKETAAHQLSLTSPVTGDVTLLLCGIKQVEMVLFSEYPKSAARLGCCFTNLCLFWLVGVATHLVTFYISQRAGVHDGIQEPGRENGPQWEQWQTREHVSSSKWRLPLNPSRLKPYRKISPTLPAFPIFFLEAASNLSIFETIPNWIFKILCLPTRHFSRSDEE